MQNIEQTKPDIINNLKNKNILVVTSDFSPSGGAEWIAYKTYNALKKRCYDSYFFASDRKPYFDNDYEFLKDFTKFRGSTKEYLKHPFSYYYNNEAKRDFKKFVTKIKPDIIHLHSIRVTLTSSVLEICENIPTVMTVHDTGIICPASTLMYKNKEICHNQKCRQGKYTECIFNKCCNNSIETSIRKTIRAYLFKNKYQKYINKFITPSDALKDEIVNSNIGILPQDIITIPNFLTEDEMQISPQYSNKGYFLYVGRLSPEKNIMFLLNTMKNLPNEIELHIAGTGTEEKFLKTFAKEHNLNNVKFLGFLDREQVQAEYQNCIATILPCNWFEIFGMTNIESFMNGKPVIASDIGGISEIVENNKNGLLFEPNNTEQLKDCILKYWNNYELAIEHGKNGYVKVKNNYTEEEYYNQLIKIYNSILI